jgi:hypothetical protein
MAPGAVPGTPGSHFPQPKALSPAQVTWIGSRNSL